MESSSRIPDTKVDYFYDEFYFVYDDKWEACINLNHDTGRWSIREYDLDKFTRESATAYIDINGIN